MHFFWENEKGKKTSKNAKKVMMVWKNECNKKGDKTEKKIKGKNQPKIKKKNDIFFEDVTSTEQICTIGMKRVAGATNRTLENVHLLDCTRFRVHFRIHISSIRQYTTNVLIYK